MLVNATCHRDGTLYHKTYLYHVTEKEKPLHKMCQHLNLSTIHLKRTKCTIVVRYICAKLEKKI